MRAWPRSRSGCTTSTSATRSRWRDLAQALAPLGCWFDVRDPGFLTLSAPGPNADAVDAYLHARGEARRELSYETGHTAPPDD